MIRALGLGKEETEDDLIETGLQGVIEALGSPPARRRSIDRGDKDSEDSKDTESVQEEEEEAKEQEEQDIEDPESSILPSDISESSSSNNFDFDLD